MLIHYLHVIYYLYSSIIICPTVSFMVLVPLHTEWCIPGHVLYQCCICFYFHNLHHWNVLVPGSLHLKTFHVDKHLSHDGSIIRGGNTYLSSVFSYYWYKHKIYTCWMVKFWTYLQERVEEYQENSKRKTQLKNMFPHRCHSKDLAQVPLKAF